MKQKAEIVPASEQDLAELAELAEQCFSDPWSENIFRQTMCCCYNRIWCAKIDGMLCGYAAISRTGDAVNHTSRTHSCRDSQMTSAIRWGCWG